MNKCFFHEVKKKKGKQRKGEGAEGREPTEKMGTEKDLFTEILKSAHFWHITAGATQEQI